MIYAALIGLLMAAAGMGFGARAIVSDMPKLQRIMGGALGVGWILIGTARFLEEFGKSASYGIYLAGDSLVVFGALSAIYILRDGEKRISQ